LPTPFSIATICFSTTVGGLELATLRRGAELQEHGHRVIAVLPEALALAEQAERLGLEHHTVTPAMKYADPFGASRLRSILEHESTDLLLVARTRDLSTAMLAAGNERAVVLYQQMQSGLDKRDWFHDRVYRRLDGCVTITKRGREELERCTALAPEKITTIAYPVDGAYYASELVDRDGARSFYGIPEDAFVVGIVGGFNPSKGQREFLEALAVASGRDAEFARRVHAIVVGRREGDASEYEQELETLRASLPFAGRVGFYPFANDTRPAYRAMDLFVLASHCETFGMVLQEAMAMGTPVIGTDCGGVPEIVRDGTTGLLVPPRDVAELADAILYLFHDPTLRSRMAARARAFVLERFDPARQYEAFEDALRRALERRRTMARRMRRGPAADS
jgi:glycosyltransferase involved in cell wall biosynthesis